MSTSIGNHTDDHPTAPSVTKTQIVQGESEMIGAPGQLVVDSWYPPSSPSPPAVLAAESSDNGLVNGSPMKKQPVWNKPSNGAPVEVGLVMGAASWPALSKSTWASTKSSPDSVKVVPDDSPPVSFDQATGNMLLPSPRQNTANSKSKTNPNHSLPVRQRSMRRNSANTLSDNSVSELPEPLIPLVGMPPNNHSHRESIKRGGSMSQSVGANDHLHQRNLFKSRNGNQHPRGEGPHNHNHGGRRDKEHENQDWNSHRSFSARDGPMQPQRVAPGFIRPPPQPLSPTPFITSPTVRPFGSPVGFPELTSPVYYFPAPPPDALRGVPFIQQMPPQAVFVSAMDPYLYARIVTQIDYYFSNENLVRDTYLRQNMDVQGWVPINLIASFNKVKLLTENTKLILDALRTSAIVEVQGDKVRKRNDWMRWTMPPVQLASISSSQSPGMLNHDMLAAQIQVVALEEKTGSNNTTSGQTDMRAEGFPSHSSSMVTDHSNSARESSKRGIFST